MNSDSLRCEYFSECKVYRNDLSFENSLRAVSGFIGFYGESEIRIDIFEYFNNCFLNLNLKFKLKLSKILIQKLKLLIIILSEYKNKKEGRMGIAPMT